MSDTKSDPFDSDITDDEHAQSESQDPNLITSYVAAEVSRYAVEILEFYSTKMDKNQALAITIEGVAETLGNLISLVAENNQPDVITDSHAVINRSLSQQQELIAQLAYGQVGHA